MRFTTACIQRIGFPSFEVLLPYSIRNFCSFGHNPKIRFRYAEEKAKKAGKQPAVKSNEDTVSPMGHESAKSALLQTDSKKDRLERAPKRMSVSKEEMEVIQLGGARP
ncbi:hypothetical protein GpartN1_g5439.t1 [Galdieria partita]|uniref:Uncharacterized protein n=1 Tax=Galdieria partita TaxID=83374 RepID=A0A9C7PZA2_9RHOD|nr:hypothetical protein GpartN1_g5439.t1 [Galdieria partita]